MKKYAHVWILIVGFVIIAAPYLYYRIPQYNLSPDLMYVKAKALWVANGRLYADPVTGIPTLHPPYYHLVLALFMRLGGNIDVILFWISVINVFLIGLFAYLALRNLFRPAVAAMTVLLIPFINRYMGSDYLFLASSFTFSFPIFLAGLWLSLRERVSIGFSVLTAFLWGVAFLVSPGYLFLIGFAFLYDLYARRDMRRFLTMAATFTITIIPFFYQAYVVSSFYAANSLGQASTFALWRGLPNFRFADSLIRNFLAPAGRAFLDWHTALVIVIIGIGTIGFIRSKDRHPFPVVVLAAYLFTFYHFNEQYASRILYVFSIFATAYAIMWVSGRERYRRPAYAAVALLLLYSTTDNVVRNIDYYAQRVKPYESFELIISRAQPKFIQYLRPGSFVLASRRSYRNYIMPYFPARSLVGARSGEYFQLPESLAKEMQADYEILINSVDPKQINVFCIVYDINYAVSFFYDNAPVFAQIDKWWQKLYSDDLLTIYRRPPKLRPPSEGGNDEG